MVVADHQPAKLYALLQIECPAWTGGRRQPAQQCPHPKQKWEVAKTLWFGHCAGMTPQVPLGDHCCADCLPPVHAGSSICKAPQFFCRVVYTERDNKQNRVRTPPIAESKQSLRGIPQSGLQRGLQSGLAPRGMTKVDQSCRLRVRATQDRSRSTGSGTRGWRRGRALRP